MRQDQFRHGHSDHSRGGRPRRSATISLDQAGEDGKLYAINPEPASSAWRPALRQVELQCHEDDRRKLIFTNVALTADGDVWWEGMTAARAYRRLERRTWTPDCGRTAAHPNARFTAPRAVPGPSTRSGRIRRACRSRRHLRRPSRRRRAARLRGPTGRRRIPRLDHGI